MNSLITVLGLPVLGNWSAECRLFVPLGHEAFCREILHEDEDDSSNAPLGQLEELLGLIDTLHRARQKPFLLLTHMNRFPGVVFKELYDSGVRQFPIRKLDRRALLSGFPRDLAVAVPETMTLLVSTRYRGRVKPRYDGWRVIRSNWGEGGRIHVSGTTAVVAEREGPIFGRQDHRALREAGIEKIVTLPQGGALVEEHDGSKVYARIGHVDVFAGLCTANDGSLHLFLDPQYPSFDKDVRTAIREYALRMCEKADITLHVPETDLLVPYSPGFVQLHGGRVILTGGEPWLKDELVKLLGPMKVFCMKQPFKRIPCYLRAGIHCLVNELPGNFLIDLLEETYRKNATG
ncbi:MAG: hypothetical protein WCO52_01280 [bacterium]